MFQPTAVTVLGGTLERKQGGQYFWIDGVFEPRVMDLRHPFGSLRCRTYGTGDTYVEVPKQLILETSALTWILNEPKFSWGQDGDRRGQLQLPEGTRVHLRPGTEDDVLPGPIPLVALVPWDQWTEWLDGNPQGAEWSKQDEKEILARAKSLGWKPPPEQ